MDCALCGDPLDLCAAKNMGVRRGARWIVRNVDFKVRRRELVYLIGANGAGKSTCAKAVLGLIDIDEGAVGLREGLDVGYVPQRLAFAPTLPLTLRRLMTLTNRLSPCEIDAALAAVGLERLGDPPVATLSGGEFQRLLLARALIHKPDLLVLDEPDQGVDEAGSGVFRELIETIRHDLDCGVLMISHDIETARIAGDNVIVLAANEQECPGSDGMIPADLMTQRDRAVSA